MREQLDRWTNNAAAGVSLVLAASLAITLAFVSWPRVAHALGLEPAAPAPAYAPGTTIDTPAAWHSRTPVTLVLFARASCGACDKAAPFLTELVSGLEGRADVVLVGGADTAGEDAAFGRAIGIREDAMHTSAGGLRVRATPTLVLVDRTGTILHAWEGVGPVEKQAVISRTVQGAVAGSAPAR